MVYKHPLKGEQLHDMMRSIAESLQLYGLETWCCRSMTLICRASIHFVPHPHFWLSALSLNFSSLSLSLLSNPSVLSLLVSNYHAVCLISNFSLSLRAPSPSSSVISILSLGPLSPFQFQFLSLSLLSLCLSLSSVHSSVPSSSSLNSF